jgi:hypothetical protein
MPQRQPRRQRLPSRFHRPARLPSIRPPRAARRLWWILCGDARPDNRRSRQRADERSWPTMPTNAACQTVARSASQPRSRAGARCPSQPLPHRLIGRSWPCRPSAGCCSECRPRGSPSR